MSVCIQNVDDVLSLNTSKIVDYVELIIISDGICNKKYRDLHLPLICIHIPAALIRYTRVYTVPISLFVCLMVLNATFNNISVVLWWSVLLMEGAGENHRLVASHWKTLSHNVVHLVLIQFRAHNISGDSHWLHR